MRRAAGVVAVTAMILFGAEQAAADEVGGQGAVSCKVIRTVKQLQAINKNPAGNYCLGNDIDANGVTNFVPLSLTGKFFGNGYAIRNLTVSDPSTYVGLFGSIGGDALVQDLRLINVTVTGTGSGVWVAGLVARVLGGTIARVHVSGEVACVAPDFCIAGGIAGVLVSNNSVILDSSSSATVTVNASGAAASYAGGAVAVLNSGAGVLRRIVATGRVNCTADTCYAGGLIGSSGGLIDLCSATGPVTVANSGSAGGLAGFVASATGVVRRSHASGAVNGANSNAGGLIGTLVDATAEESYAIGPVTGTGNVGGFFGDVPGTNTMTSLYWDIQTSGQPMDLGNTTGLKTAQLRKALPAGFGASWALTKGLSYPFLNDIDIGFNAPLATLVAKKRVYTFLPISQLERSEYLSAPANADGAALATVYTMIGRAIGITRNVGNLVGVKIDKYFWKDGTQTTAWAGPVTTRATLGALTSITNQTRLDDTNVIGALDANNLVILRGVYTKSDGSKGAHWMLATLYTKSGKAVLGVVANDPRTGQQVMIDPATKRVIWPTNFPLASFKVNGYQPVTVN